jgi:cyclic pyranopterin phosphate synthase
MTDSLGRKINYMRVSVTDLCDLRCLYCMPESGAVKRGHSDILRVEEILEIVAAAASLGISKIRITGGEPLVRKGVLQICRGIAETPGVNELSLTTNGQRLSEMANDLKAAGVKRVNVSLDTLNPVKFSKITRGGELAKTLSGITAALNAGLTPLKVNVVLMKGFNDDELEAFAKFADVYDCEVRFIELMPIGEAKVLWHNGYLSNDVVINRLKLHSPTSDGVAQMFGKIGLIDPVSRKFCSSCNRIRLTADGKIKPCLHGSDELTVRNLHGKDLTNALKSAILSKPAAHDGLTDVNPSQSLRGMSKIGG